MIASISRNLASCLIALVASASLLAGCNGDDTGATNTDTASTTNPTTTNPTTTVAESDSSTSATDTATTTTTTDPTTTTTSPETTTGPICGDGTLDDGEQCDDGNNDDGDGCTADCMSEGSSMCDPYSQDCPEGQKCTASNAMAGDFWNINICIEVMGTQTEGSSCTVLGDEPGGGIDDCDAGLICLFADEEGKNGTCVAFCTGDSNNGMCEGKNVCVPANGGLLPICLLGCDPLLQDCPFDQGCYGDDQEGNFLCFEPDPQSGGMDNDNCAFTNDCLPGFQCLNPAVVAECQEGNDGCCNPFCELDGDASECNTDKGEVCSAFFAEEIPPWENVGICTLP